MATFKVFEHAQVAGDVMLEVVAFKFLFSSSFIHVSEIIIIYCACLLFSNVLGLCRVGISECKV